MTTTVTTFADPAGCKNCYVARISLCFFELVLPWVDPDYSIALGKVARSLVELSESPVPEEQFQIEHSTLNEDCIDVNITANTPNSYSSVEAQNIAHQLQMLFLAPLGFDGNTVYLMTTAPVRDFSTLSAPTQSTDGSGGSSSTNTYSSSKSSKAKITLSALLVIIVGCFTVCVMGLVYFTTKSDRRGSHATALGQLNTIGNTTAQPKVAVNIFYRRNIISSATMLYVRAILFWCNVRAQA